MQASLYDSGKVRLDLERKRWCELGFRNGYVDCRGTPAVGLPTESTFLLSDLSAGSVDEVKVQ